jgi:hypothetical protein
MIFFFAWCAMMVAVLIGLAHEPAFPIMVPYLIIASFGVVALVNHLWPRQA